MTIRILVSIWLLVATSPGFGQSNDCECVSYPFRPDPPCFEFCYTKVIAGPDEQVDDLFNVLNISAELQKLTIALRGTDKFSDYANYSFSEFHSSGGEQLLNKFYSQDDQKLMRNAFENANQYMLNNILIEKLDGDTLMDFRHDKLDGTLDEQ